MTAVVIFAKNEERAIGRVIDDLKTVLKTVPELNGKLFLCDDSMDKTAEIAENKGVEVIKGSGRGLGWSYYLTLYLLLNQRKERFDSIITVDGDGQTDLSEAPCFYREFKKGYDLIVGSRFLKKKSISYNYSKVNFIGVKILASVITVSALRRFSDSHGGLRVMGASVAGNMNFLGGHSYVQETIIDSANRGFKIKELASAWHRRPYGESRVVRSKIKYIKAMAWPLLVRTRIHGLVALISLTVFILSGNFFSACLFGFCVFMELYKQVTFRKNKTQIRKQAQKRKGS